MSQSFAKNMDLKITPIVAYGLVFLMVMIGYLGLDKLVDKNSQLAQKLIVEQENLHIMQTIQASDIWEGRLAQSIEIRDLAKDSLWPGKSAGVIAAQFQQEIRKIAKTLEAKNVRIQVEAEPVSIENTDMLAFEFSAFLPIGDTVFALYNALAQQQHIVLVQDSNFSHSLRDKHPTRLIVSGFIPIKISASTPQNKQDNIPKNSLEEIMP